MCREFSSLTFTFVSFSKRSGFKAFRNGQTQKSQVLMRGRVAAQAFTVIAMGVGAYLGMKPNAGPKTMEEKMERRDAADQVTSGSK